MCQIFLLALLPVAYAETLYNESTFQPLAADHRARRPGDLVMVTVLENSSAATATGASAQRDQDVGLSADITGRRKFGANLSTENGYDANGRAQRSGRLLAQISAAVVMVRPNGDLVISGRQILDINDEKQEIFLSGVVRPIDIGDDNTVPSSRLAEASIRYAGQGELADRQKPGWWNRLLHVLGW
ncbi:flagellar basal body L-ring protein FlgH [Chitinimonas sp. BJB300]|uniref:flagellar basal body L-ring protein FlgH n=1 Tax=Chitinimonas sp. BJB300 TaxID=1559339 RepID=UPI0013047B69|nr:flagellar basal body L-ring protein FlgH [Chitinimonas sp. BJB300]